MILPSPSILTRSLRVKVLAPLLASTVLMGVLGIALTRSMAGTLLESQLDLRVALMADAISDAADSGFSEGTFGHIVASLGGQSDVKSLLVIANDPPVVIASTRSAWRGLGVSDIPDEQIRLALASSSRVRERISTDGRSVFNYIVPLSLDGVIDQGLIFVQLDSEQFSKSLGRSSTELMLLMLLSMSAIALVAFSVFHYSILQPLSQLRKMLDLRRCGDYAARVQLTSRDELGTLAMTINDMLDAVDDGRAELHKLALVASRTSSGVVIADAKAQVEWTNHAFSLIQPLSPASSPSTDLVELIIPDDLTGPAAMELRSCIDEGVPLRREFHVVGVEGDSRWLALELQPIYTDNHRLINFVALCSDITDLKKAEERLSKRDARLRLLNQISTSMIYDASPEQIIQSTVQTLARFFQDMRTSYATVASDGTATFVHSVAPELDQLLFQKSFPLGSATSVHSALEHRNAVVIEDINDDQDIGGLRNHLERFGIRSMVAAPVVHDNRLVGVLLLDSNQPRDWSNHEIDSLTDAADYLSLAHRDARAKAERTRSTQRMRRFNDDLLEAKTLLERQKNELAATNKELTETSLAAEAASKSKSEFLANMSHEIRTPMTAILGYADLLVLEDQSKAELYDRVATIKRNGEHLMDVINDILDLSKVEAGQLAIEFDDFDPRKLMNGVITLLRQRAVDKGIDLEAVLSDDVPEQIRSDPTRLRQILVNLIGNAIKFTAIGSVKIFVKPGGNTDDKRLEFKVIDTGIGLSLSQAQAIFEPFRQADTSTTRQFGGTGLGLTISKKLANALDGDVVVESTHGTGSAFTLEIGYQEPQTCVVAISNDSIPSRGTQPQCLKGVRILLVEDGADNQRLISFHLKRAGAEVDVAEDGQIGLNAVTDKIEQGHPFDLIIMDMQMPVMDGYAATEAIRVRNITTPIIALTAHAMSSDRQRCLDAGCDDYETKPINSDRLIGVCRKWLDSGEQNKAA